MAGRVASGTLLFVLLIGASFSFPTKKGSDSGSQDSGYDDVSGDAQVTYSKPGVFRGADTSLGGGAPMSAGYGSYLGSNQVNLGPAASQETNWIVSPIGVLSDNSAMGGAMSSPGLGQSHGSHSHASLPDSPSSLFQPGELSHMQNTFEHGNYDTETENQGLPFQQAGSLPDGSLPGIPEMMASGVGGLSLPYYPGYYVPYPYYDWMFLTGQYPPGTVSHFSSDFEQGRDYYHDAHYNKYYPGPDDQTGQQAKIFPSIKPGKQTQQGGAAF